MSQTPKGVKDLLPEDVSRREQIIARIRNVFAKKGFQRIVTPTFELFDTLKVGLPEELQKRSFRFFDDQGRLLVMRPDMTVPIARVVASRLKTAPKPIKLYYMESVFRQPKPESGRESEVFQIGAELIGDPSPKADKEIISLAKECLKAVGIKKFAIEVSDVKYLKKLPAKKRQALLDQNFVEYGSLPTRKDLVVRDIDYYTGMIFDCYVPGFGYLLGGGGRYDTLIKKFGTNMPAVGFAFTLEKILAVLEK
jgi:ATP phosphoribosyltransferase regulatory subunit HisZ